MEKRPKFKLPPITISVQSIKCLEETDEVGADEPYVLVTAVDLAKPIPRVEVTRYGPWSDVDQGETKVTQVLSPKTPAFLKRTFEASGLVRTPFWGLDNKSADRIDDPSDVVIIASMMEHDDGQPEPTRAAVKASVVATLASSVGLSRSNRVQKLIKDIRSAVRIPTGAPNFDDHIQTKELRLTHKDLARPMTGVYRRPLYFRGDGGHYKVIFEFRKG